MKKKAGDSKKGIKGLQRAIWATLGSSYEPLYLWITYNNVFFYNDLSICIRHMAFQPVPLDHNSLSLINNTVGLFEFI